MLKVKRFVNELMSSNCFVVYDNEFDDCIVVDPGSRECLKEINFFNINHLKPSFVILTHEHTDHTWGCNAMISRYNTKVVCSKRCAERLDKESRAYFLFYYDDTKYEYHIKKVDIYAEDLTDKFYFHGKKVVFFITPGHSLGSMCFSVGNYFFTGDTLMLHNVFFDKKHCTMEMYNNSVAFASKLAMDNRYTVCPGHGKMFKV